MIKIILLAIFYLTYGLLILGCTNLPPTQVPLTNQAQPGLATQWGETRTSRTQVTPFTRAQTTPTVTDMLYYNDRDGIRAMTGLLNYQTQLFPVVDGFVFWGIENEAGQLLESVLTHGKKYVLGNQGQRYSIVIHNRSANRLEAVLSVDGLDVLDGKTASFSKRGYLIDPHSKLEVEGFRQSMDTIAAFRFGSVSESYANQKYGDTRNVGVIGLALFHESGTVPFSSWTPDEIKQRHTADPFPGRFATPPD